MNFQQLKYALTLAQEKSFTKASEKLYITQPTLSFQIKALEDELNTPLFIRHRKGIQLTCEGELFIEFANETLQKFDKCQTKMEHLDQLGGNLTIGLYWMFGYTKYGHLMDAFTKEHPNINCSFIIDGSIPLIDKMIHNELDIAIITGIYTINDHDYINLSKHLNIILLDESPLVLLANKNSSLAIKQQIKLTDLDNQNLFMVSKASNLYPFVANFFKETEVRPNIIGHSSQADICFQVAQYNLAYSFVTLTTYQHYPNKEDVIAINITPTITRKLYLIYPKKSLNSSINKLKEYLLTN